MDKTITQEDVEKAAEKYVYERQKIRHYAKSEEDATMRDFDKTLKAWDAYDMEQSFEAGAAYALGKTDGAKEQKERDDHYIEMQKAFAQFDKACDGTIHALDKLVNTLDKI